MTTSPAAASDPSEDRATGSVEPTPRGIDMETLEHDAALRDVMRSLFRREALAELEAPSIGRFEIIRRIGTGGMGSVYEARDPTLDRRVAVKVLHTEIGSGQRLVEEGKAMARLNHPNVVTVHEVDTADGRAFVVMELVEGVSLRRWQRERRRSWGEIVDMYRALGAGIEAAHAVGLVHRDLKPENVLIGADGRPRVSDFGIARLHEEPAGDSHAASDHALDHRATTIAGTPRYMSPEQYQGAAILASSDQFSYCVMLWEALYGVPPFAGHGTAELRASITAGDRRPPPTGTAVPAWLRRVCERGLAPEAAERWPSMTVLLEHLERGRARVRRRNLGLGLAVLGLTAMLVQGGRMLQQARATAACERAGSEIDEVWNERRRAGIEAGINGSGVRHAAATMDKLESWLDRRASAWSEARTSACLRRDVEGRWDDDAFERASWCLEDRRAELDVTLERLERPTLPVVSSALDVAHLSSDVEECLDDAVLSRVALPPTSDRQEVEALGRERARAFARSAEGDFEGALEVARAALLRAEMLGWAPLTSSLRIVVATHLVKVGEYDQAYAEATRAYFDSMAADAPEVTLRSAVTLVFIAGQERGHDLAEVWFQHADALVERLGLRGKPAEARNLVHMALAKFFSGRFEGARQMLDRALEIQRDAYGMDDRNTINTLDTMAMMASTRGDVDESIAMHRRVLEATEHFYGPDHPNVANSLNGLATALLAARRHVEAAPLLERALSIVEESGDVRAERKANILSNLGSVNQLRGRLPEAAEQHAAAVELLVESKGPSSAPVAMARGNLAGLQLEMGRLDDAYVSFIGCLEIFEATQASDVPYVALTLRNLGDVEMRRGELDSAERYYERALAIYEREDEANPIDLVDARIGLGLLRIEQQRPAEALESAQTLLDSEGSGVLPVAQRGEIELLLGSARWALGEREEAVAGVRRTRETMLAAGPNGAKWATLAEEWLSTRAVDLAETDGPSAR